MLRTKQSPGGVAQASLKETNKPLTKEGLCVLLFYHRKHFKDQLRFLPDQNDRGLDRQQVVVLQDLAIPQAVDR